MAGWPTPEGGSPGGIVVTNIERNLDRIVTRELPILTSYEIYHESELISLSRTGNCGGLLLYLQTTCSDSMMLKPVDGAIFMAPFNIFFVFFNLWPITF